MSKKVYFEEFKLDVAGQALSPGRTIRGVAADLGVAPGTVGGWVRRYRDQVSGSSTVPPIDDLLAENKRLKQQTKKLQDRCNELDEGREILKKATRFFAAKTKNATGSSKNTRKPGT